MGTDSPLAAGAARAPMRALRRRSAAPWDVGIERVSVPVPGPGEVLLRPEAVGLCGSDVHAVRGDLGYEWVPSPVTLGHEVAGTVAAVGAGVDPALIGRRGVMIAIDGCGTCERCARGHTNYCAARTCRGLHADGGLAEYQTLRADRLFPLPEGDTLDPALAALIEPCAIGIQALRQIDRPLAGLRIGISGPGAVGLLCAVAALDAGALVRVYGPPSGAEGRMGFARTLGAELGEPGDDAPADAWIEASGAGPALGDAILRLSPRSTVVIPAMFARRVELDVNPIVRAGLRLQGTYGYDREDYARAHALISRTAGRLAPMIERFPLEGALDALRLTERAALIKAVVIPGPAPAAPDARPDGESETR